MNVSPTMAVAMAPAASPGSVPVMKVGEDCSVTKVSQGGRDEAGTRNETQCLDPSSLAAANLALPLSFKYLGTF